MGYLLPALTPRAVRDPARRRAERAAAELREPPVRAGADGADRRRCFRPIIPYHWMTIGAAEDIRAMQLEDVQAFFRTYYHPANASLVLAGDIDTERGFDLAERYFGELPPGARPAPVSRPPALTREQRLLLEDRVELPRLYMAWHSPAMFADGRRRAGSAGRPAGQRQDVAAVSHARLRAAHGARRVGVPELARAGRLLPARRHRGAGHVADRDRGAHRRRAAAGSSTTGPTDGEMERAAAQAEAHFIYRLQTVGGFGGKSDQLNAYNVLRGDPGFFAADLERYRAATRETGARGGARATCAFDRRVLLSVVPRGQPALALPGSEPVAVS